MADLDSEKSHSWQDVAEAPLVCEICGKVDSPETPDTATVLLEMLLENTGRALCDSGDAYGRNWERNQANGIEAIRNEPAAFMDYDSPTLSTFHYLNERLTYAPVLDLSLKGFMAKSQDSYLEDIENWLDFLGVEKENDQGFYETPRTTMNTYNFEGCRLGQTLQFVIFELNGVDYVALQIHGGADVRGGYTAPRVFKCDRDALLFADTAELYCLNCDLGLEWQLYGIEILREPKENAEKWNDLVLNSPDFDLNKWDFHEAGCPNCGAKEWQG
jgi:hypothetical protein